MKKLHVNSLMGMLFVLLALGGCMEERELRYTGPTVVEFKNHLFGRVAGYLPTGVYPNQSGTPMTTLSKYISVETRGKDSVLVQLIGPQLSSDSQIEFSIAENSTAVEGTHFEFESAGSRTVTLPANSSSTYIVYDLIPGSLETGETVTLRLNLIGNDQVGFSQNYSQFTTYLRQ
ncbi:hypothetical protein [Parapedobacter koreensis]|nr:hypothetical protein [Parapedobacter koreensis]